jgi:hypothetical protein
MDFNHYQGVYKPLVTVSNHNIFLQHTVYHYVDTIKKEYARKESEVKIEEESVTLAQSMFVTPSVEMIEIHHFTHNKTAALCLEGENLYFTSSIKLHLDTSKKDCEIAVVQDTSISRRYIVIEKKLLPLPSEFSKPSDDGASNVYQECEETARVRLFTNFGEFKFRDVKVRHKVL